MPWQILQVLPDEPVFGLLIILSLNLDLCAPQAHDMQVAACWLSNAEAGVRAAVSFIETPVRR